jgi:hypothetical protein
VALTGFFCLAANVLPGPARAAHAHGKERAMMSIRQQRISIFVDRSSRQWVVQDPEGTFWVVPAIDEAWEHRQPFVLTDECELESVPSHYKNLLGLPF